MSEENKTHEDLQRIDLEKAKAVNQAMVEFLSENRQVIIVRAAAKLAALGIKVDLKDFGTTE